MRVACVDKNASDRIKLEQLLEDGFRTCRRSIGHLLLARFFPASKEEVLVNSSPDAIIVGPNFEVEESLIFVREVRTVHNKVPIFIFLSSENFNVKNLKRFESYVTEIFSVEDPSSRYVYSITSSGEQHKERVKGSLLTIKGVKGGVGATTISCALAHALQGIEKTVVVVDLSQNCEIGQFLLADKYQSIEFSDLLTSRSLPDSEHIDKMLVNTASGIPILPPPSGGGEIRDLLLRDPSSFEISLSVIDLLQDRFDVVIVDLNHSEGILSFALNCRADIRFLISANDPASVHLLTNVIDESHQISDGITKIVVNKINPSGLTNDDVLDFISWNPNFDLKMLYPNEIPFDARAGMWVGTGNTFYTEGSKKTKLSLEYLAKDLLGLEVGKIQKRIPFINTVNSLSEVFIKKEITFPKLERLPYLFNKSKNNKIDDKKEKLEKEETNTLLIEQETFEEDYEPPKLIINN